MEYIWDSAGNKDSKQDRESKKSEKIFVINYKKTEKNA